jgi:hypothetical protein
MTANYCKIDTLDLFNDLKDTNISFSEFKNIIASYNKLESSYIKDKQVDLLKDLNKQKNVIFSYLTACKNEPIKKMARLAGNLEKEFGNIDEMNTFSKADKNAKFIKVSYNNGKWSISADGLSDDLEFNKKQAPEAIDCLIQLADRLDEQDAAYALCHAKKAGLFTMAALPFVRTDINDTLFQTRYEKTPTTSLGPIEKPSDAVYTTNLPVSRQIASEDGLDDEKIDETSVFVDEEGTLIPVTLVTDDYVLTSQDNGVYSIDEVKENLKTGKWKRQAADKADIKLKRLEKQAEDLMKLWEEKLILDESAQRLKDEFDAKLQQKLAPRMEQLDEAQAMVEPRLRKIAAKIDEITFKDKEGKQKLQKLKQEIGNMILKYQRPVEEYRMRAVSKVEEVEALLERARKYVSPKNLKAFEENVVNKFFYYESSQEKFEIALKGKDPRNEEMIQDEIKKLRKEIKTSQNTAFDKDAAYNKLDNLLISGTLNFEQYNTLTDFAEINSKKVLASLELIENGMYKIVKAGFLQDIGNKIVELYNNVKDWLSNIIPFLMMQERDITEINEGLDEIIEGE